MDEQTKNIIRQLIRQELEFFMRGDKFLFGRPIELKSGVNIQLGSEVGTMIGTESTQKLGFYGKTPIVQPGAIASPSGGTTVDSEARNAIGLLRVALINLGLTQ